MTDSMLPPVATNTDSPTASETAALSNKRPKPTMTPIDYPKNVPMPSKQLISILHDKATIEQPDLTDAGLLSLQEVLIPAIGHCEDEALKLVLSKVKRDRRLQTHHINNTRKFANRQICKAQKSVAENRAKRHQRDAERQAAQEAQLPVLKQQALQEQQKQHPPNKELWAEVAFLMTELTHLEREEQVWKEVEESLQHAVAEQKQQQENQDPPSPISVPVPPEVTELAETADRIVLSTKRIQKALNAIQETATAADAARVELFDSYTRVVHFQNYPGHDNPKELLAQLSQSQDDF